MADAARLFVDTSALFSGIWSAEGGARALLLLGETRAVQLVASHSVLQELEAVCRRKAPDTLGQLALLLDRAHFEIARHPAQRAIIAANQWTGHLGDARIMAAALLAKVDFFVTLDRTHLLGNERLAARVPFPIGTPGDALAWLRQRWSYGVE